MKINFKNPLFILAAGVLLVTGSIVTATKATGSGVPEAQAVTFSTAKLSVELQEKQDDTFVTVQETRNSDGSIDRDNLGKLALTSMKDINDGSEMPDPEKSYPEVIQVKNTGTVDEYVRVVVYKSWLDSDGTKDSNLDTSLIHLNTVEGDDWLSPEDSDSKESTVYYLTKPLKSGETAQLLQDITFDKDVLKCEPIMTKTSEGLKAEIAYDYDGKILEVEVRVDAVQTHSAEDSIFAAWGVMPKFDENGNITSVEE
ncbi:MAG: hypothetical protein IJR96_00360 [Pseudobutyrivibrio sp.]|nr:hypothetical protein [Pseudobutyrivibrio sp.]